MGDWTGVLALHAKHKHDKTIVSDIYFQGALKVTRPFYHDPSGEACYYIMNPGGGYVDGDRYKLNFQLEQGAKLLLTSQSATKIYKTPQRPVQQEVEIRVGSGSCLEFVNDPVIAYEDAQFIQHTTVHLEQGASFLSTDILTPGWSPLGELFKYELLQLKTEIFADDELVLFDHLKLQPKVQKLDSLGIFEGYTHFGSMIVIDSHITAEWLDQLYNLMKEHEAEARLGLSMLSIAGFTLRVLASSSQEIEKIFELCHNYVRQEVFGKESIFLRKY